jgi:hypothetical protein
VCTRRWRLVKDPERVGVSGVVGGKYRARWRVGSCRSNYSCAGCHLEHAHLGSNVGRQNGHMRSGPRRRAVSDDGGTLRFLDGEAGG